MITVQIESYGCAMNQGEAYFATSFLRSRGYDAIEVEQGQILKEAQACILFTCDVVQTTENRMLKRIKELSNYGKKVFIAGCLASIAGPEIMRRYPDLVIIDTMGLDRIVASLSSCFPKEPDQPPENGMQIKRLHHIVPISTGCIGSCSYCITKLARGHIKSYPMEGIVAEVKRGIMSGKREILITSQDCASYGYDTRSGTALDELMEKIVEEAVGAYRIRIGMMNPDTVIPDLNRILDAFDHPPVFKFFHVPIQSGSDRILKAMGRKHSFDDYRSLFEAIKKRYPGATISTDLIVGFPGEDASDHQGNLQAVMDLSPDILNITRYSPRPGTKASSLDGMILQRTVKERSREIARSHSDQIERKLRGRIGETIECIVTERVKVGTVMARDMNYSPVVVQGNIGLGLTVPVLITSTGPTYLRGEVKVGQ